MESCSMGLQVPHLPKHRVCALRHQRAAEGSGQDGPSWQLRDALAGDFEGGLRIVVVIEQEPDLLRDEQVPRRGLDFACELCEHLCR